LVAPLEQIFRDEWGRVLASLIGFLGDLDLAEEAAQEALQSQPSAGLAREVLPTRARGW
jgi:RNA polymerase sigma-70 factor (ECF subfamily)